MTVSTTTRQTLISGRFARSCLLVFCMAITTAAIPEAAITDRDVSDKIDKELLIDPAVTANSIDVETENGIVTLTGSAASILARERAARIAETVRGVRSVINRIAVEPVTDSTPEELRTAVVNALFFDPATEAYEIETDVDEHGHVTLGGKVDSWQELELAATVVKGVSGVTGITNNIRVMYREERPDTEILTDIQRRMHWDTLLDDSMIDVRVAEGKVTLSGTVGSAAELRRAEMDAQVGGVEAMDTSGLQVAKWARDEALRHQKYLPKSDLDIRAAIMEALIYDPRVSLFNIDVKVRNGKVTLRGIVDNIQARRSAAQDARNTVGAVWVDNLIKVRSGEQLDDATIVESIATGLQHNPYTQSYQIDVSVKNGTAYLDGEVETNFEKAEAENVAFRVRGVTRVRNRLTVSFPEIVVHDPYVYVWSIYEYPWYKSTTPASHRDDFQIAREIRDELFWSPFVNSDDIDVSVDNGVATLLGKVGSWGEYHAAEENAFEGGAASVINQLRVD